MRVHLCIALLSIGNVHAQEAQKALLQTHDVILDGSVHPVLGRLGWFKKNEKIRRRVRKSFPITSVEARESMLADHNWHLELRSGQWAFVITLEESRAKFLDRIFNQPDNRGRFELWWDSLSARRLTSKNVYITDADRGRVSMLGTFLANGNRVGTEVDLSEVGPVKPAAINVEVAEVHRFMKDPSFSALSRSAHSRWTFNSAVMLDSRRLELRSETSVFTLVFNAYFSSKGFLDALIAAGGKKRYTIYTLGSPLALEGQFRLFDSEAHQEEWVSLSLAGPYFFDFDLDESITIKTHGGTFGVEHVFFWQHPHRIGRIRVKFEIDDGVIEDSDSPWFDVHDLKALPVSLREALYKRTRPSDRDICVLFNKLLVEASKNAKDKKYRVRSCRLAVDQDREQSGRQEDALASGDEIYLYSYYGFDRVHPQLGLLFRIQEGEKLFRRVRTRAAVDRFGYKSEGGRWYFELSAGGRDLVIPLAKKGDAEFLFKLFGNPHRRGQFSIWVDGGDKSGILERDWVQILDHKKRKITRLHQFLGSGTHKGRPIDFTPVEVVEPLKVATSFVAFGPSILDKRTYRNLDARARSRAILRTVEFEEDGRTLVLKSEKSKDSISISFSDSWLAHRLFSLLTEQDPDRFTLYARGGRQHLGSSDVYLLDHHWHDTRWQTEKVDRRMSWKEFDLNESIEIKTTSGNYGVEHIGSKPVDLRAKNAGGG